MAETVIRKILALLFGNKYYANISYRRGLAEDRFINSTIFRTKEEANRHARDLESNSSFGYIQTISFRSRQNY